jgi:hypothetical protein
MTKAKIAELRESRRRWRRLAQVRAARNKTLEAALKDSRERVGFLERRPSLSAAHDGI